MRLILNKQLPADQLKTIAARERYKQEIGGTTLNGQAILTDRDSQSMCNGAVAYLSNKEPGATIRFKGVGGWAELDLATMTAIAMAVGDHVQACFTKEHEVGEAIAAGTITTEAQVIAAFA